MGAVLLDRLNQAMEYVESHLDQRIEVAELARIALTSDYHFRRLFSALAGLPLSEYIRRRRLTVAVAEVLSGSEALLEIAVRYGYSSGEAFARAFRAMHGVGPGEVRRTGAVLGSQPLSSQPRMSFRLVVEGSSSMRYRIVEKDEFRVVGLKARVPLVYEGPNEAIISFVRSVSLETSQRLKELSDQEPRGIVAVTSNLEPPRTEGSELDYHHAVVTSAEPPEGLDVLTVPAGTWAVFTTSGRVPESIQYLWRDVFTQWFPSNPYESVPGPEILRTQLSADGTEGEAELWIPVERVSG